jgi:hypothetical protein
MKGRPQKYTAIGLCVGAVPAGRPAVRVGHSPLDYDGMFYEPRTTAFLGLRCGFAATDSGWYYDRVPSVINSGYAQDSRRDALWASPTASHTGDEKLRGYMPRL